MAIMASARSARLLPRSSAMPCSVMMTSASARNVVTGPESLGTIRLTRFRPAVEPSVMIARPSGEARPARWKFTCPPIAHPCFFGVDMGTHDELIAHHLSVEEICAHIGADSLGFLSVEGMMKALDRTDGYCNACFTGDYPVPVQLQLPTTAKQRFDGVLA